MLYVTSAAVALAAVLYHINQCDKERAIGEIDGAFAIDPDCKLTIEGGLVILTSSDGKKVINYAITGLSRYLTKHRRAKLAG